MQNKSYISTLTLLLNAVGIYIFFNLLFLFAILLGEVEFFNCLDADQFTFDNSDFAIGLNMNSSDVKKFVTVFLLTKSKTIYTVTYLNMLYLSVIRLHCNE